MALASLLQDHLNREDAKDAKVFLFFPDQDG